MAGGVGKLYKNLDLQGNKITGSADPSAGTDLVNLQYLQNFLNGVDWKNSVRAASTGNVNIASPGASIDGVTLSSGNRVLLKDQTDASENGIYVWNGGAAAMTRASDSDVNSEVTSGMATYVEEGTSNGSQAYVLTTPNPITVGTTDLEFAQFGGGTLPVAGNGLTLSGSTLAVGAGTGILSNANDVAIDPSVVPRKFTNSGTHSAGSTVSLTHNLGHKDYAVSVKINATGEDITSGVDIMAGDNSVDVGFSSSQAANSIRVTVIG